MKRLCLTLVLAVTLIISAMQAVGEVEAYWDNDVTHPYICQEAAKVFNNTEILDYLPYILIGAYDEDATDHIWGLPDSDLSILTYPHFWDADNGDKDLVLGVVFAYPNANRKSKLLWTEAVEFYANGDKQSAYERLGHVCHLIQDMGVPTHVHEDFHIRPLGDDDCYEDWMGESVPPARGNWDADDALAAGGLINIPEGPHGMSLFPLYYLMYTTNQYADYFASDDYDGDTDDRHGWIDYTGWPSTPTTTDHLEDNDDGDNDDDGDLSTIGNYAFVYSIRATATIYRVFSEAVESITLLHPSTILEVGNPKWTAIDNVIHVTSDTLFTLTTTPSPSGSEAVATAYCIYNDTYSSGFLSYAEPFHLEGLTDGTYCIEYNSTDATGNMEPENFAMVDLDNNPPLLTVVTPQAGFALQDGVMLNVSTWDLSQVSSVTFSIRNADGSIMSPELETMEASPSLNSNWQLYFDTIDLLDGMYLFVANGTDVLGNTGAATVLFGIQNWASAELLPTSQSSKAGRTMPVKFTLRVAASVNPDQPFIYNEELAIKVYTTDNPANILQTSTFGEKARDYRIDTLNELYITNFQTLKTPKTYVVEIWREALLIGTFNFSTAR